jgi:hypothetical protein
MALQVIGAGLGRTGTFTLKMALEQLGFSPCHHMVEVFGNPEQREFWLRAAEGQKVDWEKEIFSKYRASVDWPSCHFYKELAAYYPQAKVLLSWRDPERWFESMDATILRVMERAMKNEDPRGGDMKFAELIVGKQTFNYDFSKENVIAAYNRHVAEVKRVIPAERLLVHESKDGWGPLCEFLGVPVPSTEYPRTNSKEEFRSRAMLDAN